MSQQRGEESSEQSRTAGLGVDEPAGFCGIERPWLQGFRETLAPRRDGGRRAPERCAEHLRWPDGAVRPRVSSHDRVCQMVTLSRAVGLAPDIDTRSCSEDAVMHMGE